MNAYLLIILLVNPILGSNYLFPTHKPGTPSLIDLLGPRSWYILGMEAVGVAIALVLYLPFFINDGSRRYRKAAMNP